VPSEFRTTTYAETKRQLYVVKAISAEIVSGPSSGFSAHSHHRSKASLLSFMRF